MSEFLSIREVAEIVRKDPSTVRKWCREGHLVAMPPSIFGRNLRVSRAALDAFQRTGLDDRKAS